MTLAAGPRTPAVEAIAFGWIGRAGAYETPRDSTVRAVYRLGVNDWQGQCRPQLLIDHLEPTETTRML